PWDNRITMVLLAAFAVTMWALKDSYSASQATAAAVPGLIVVAIIWLLGLVLGKRDNAQPEPPHSAGNADPPPQKSPQPDPPPKSQLSTANADEKSKTGSPGVAVGSATSGATAGQQHPATVTPAPEVTQMINDLMGGRKS
ncbi:MAG: hypothetical protein KDA85_11590, partial [Planctomycetaceae bacterium]|nr:hypothetical protein [Planctomycetaceae bacterium]